MPLNAAQILEADDRKTASVQVPEWGANATVLVGTMGALARARMFDWIDMLGQAPTEQDDDEVLTCDTPQPEETEELEKQYSHGDDMRVIVRWCAECILDPETRKPAFADNGDALGDKDPVALMRIYRAAIDLNAVTEEARDELEKNSEGTAADDSGSD